MSDRSLQLQLESFGLHEIEAKIYLYLVNKEPQTILEIARALGLPRTSIYDNSTKLLEKGLVRKEIGYKTQKFQAAPLAMIEGLIDKERERITQMEDDLSKLQQNLAHAFIPNATTQVRYYHGVQGFQQMMWNALDAEKELIGYSQFGRVEVVGEKFALRHHEETKNRKLVDRVITNPRKDIIDFLSLPIEIERRTYQHIRFVDQKDLYVSGDVTIYNNVFAVCYWQQGEVVGVEIENAELVKQQKSIFEQMWQIAQPWDSYLLSENL